MKNCWSQIGISGDRSCPELQTFTHCRNCPVYSAEGRRLLERDVPATSLREWTSLLATAPAKSTATLPSEGALKAKALPSLTSIALLVFRLQSEWLALPAHLFKEMTPPTIIHTLPHRSNEILLGLVNIRGELQMCASLANLLDLETAQASIYTASPVVYERMMVTERNGECWVFPVDEIYGVERVHPDELKSTPTNIAKSTNTYTKGLISWRDTHISVLDDELLFYTLTRRVL
jgi:chemotaxis-related protein WspD